tara:strand:+ start:4126 stop:4845 length:720 start_codon:yes stop_codon:yes gene_type:complete
MEKKMSSLIKFVCGLITGLILSAIIIFVFNPQITEVKISNYLDKNPEKIDDFSDIVDQSRKYLIRKQNLEIIKENHSFFENQKFYIGNPEGSKIIYEFFDYNCGFCKRVFSDLMDLASENKDVKIVFIELPVLGQSSLLASKAAYEAFNRGKYFEMHQKLINHRGKITIEDINVFAEEINIDPDLLIKNINNLDTSFIKENYRIADKLNINGTPTFIIGDEIIPGAIDKALMVQLISSY